MKPHWIIECINKDSISTSKGTYFLETHVETRNNYTFWVHCFCHHLLSEPTREPTYKHLLATAIKDRSLPSFLSLFFPSWQASKEKIKHFQAFYTQKEAHQSPVNSYSQVILPSAAHLCKYPQPLPISSAPLLPPHPDEVQLVHLASFTPFK